jgi:hypothetical protein
MTDFCPEGYVPTPSIVDSSLDGDPSVQTGRTRHVVLTNEGISFFRQLTAGRAGSEIMLRKANGETWRASHQLRPIAQACHHAKIEPPVSFHALRQHLGKQRGHERRAAGRCGEEPGSRRHAWSKKHYGT